MPVRRFPVGLASVVAASVVAGIAGFMLSSNDTTTVARTFVVTPAYAGAADGGALFKPIADVLRHPRCMNCHPRGDRPRQGEDGHLHLQNVVRGADGMGFTNMRCTTCHRDENNAYSGVPGAPSWHLAPLSMGWEGLDDAALCSTLKDKTKNGDRDVAALISHMTDDKLVLWGWQPGGDRQPVPTPHAEFVKQLKAWESAGAPCP